MAITNVLRFTKKKTGSRADLGRIPAFGVTCEQRVQKVYLAADAFVAAGAAFQNLPEDYLELHLLAVEVHYAAALAVDAHAMGHRIQPAEHAIKAFPTTIADIARRHYTLHPVTTDGPAVPNKEPAKPVQRRRTTLC